MLVIASMSPVDEFIYSYLIRTGMLVVVCVLLWVLATVYSSKDVLHFFRKSRATIVGIVGEHLHIRVEK